MLEDYLLTMASYYAGKVRDSLLERMVFEGQEQSRPQEASMKVPRSMRKLIGKDHPLGISERIIERTLKVIAFQEGPLARAQAIYSWVTDNIEYDSSPVRRGYRNARQVYEGRRGVCGEMAHLYIAMARIAGLECQYLRVDLTRDGQKNHACALLRLDGEDIQVDPAAKGSGFGIRHQSYQPLGDATMVANYYQWNGKTYPKGLWMELHKEEHRHEGDFHEGSCRKYVHDLITIRPLSNWPEYTWKHAVAVALGLGLLSGLGAGVYAGGKMLMEKAAAEERREASYGPRPSPAHHEETGRCK